MLKLALCIAGGILLASVAPYLIFSVVALCTIIASTAISAFNYVFGGKKS